jgi:DNA-binding MarR family transcriptional regulator
MPDRLAQLDEHLAAADQRLQGLRAATDKAREQRAVLFALAQNHGRSSGDIARQLRIHPSKVTTELRLGRRILADRERRRRLEQEVAAA